MMRTSRETIYKRFLIFICRIVGEMLGLEFCGPIGLVILNNCYTAKKKCCTH